MHPERPRDMTPAIQQLQRLEPGARLLHEGVHRKPRMRPGQIRGQATNERWREECLERVGHDAIIPKSRTRANASLITPIIDTEYSFGLNGRICEVR
jgi:hypothetical protein